MSTPSPVSERRVEALLKGELGRDESELRLQALVGELRGSATPLPDGLRERVRELAVAGPTVRRPTRLRDMVPSFSVGRAVAAFGSLFLVVGLGAAAVEGLRSASSDPRRPLASRPYQGQWGALERVPKRQRSVVEAAGNSGVAAQAADNQVLNRFGATLPPNVNRLQAYDAYLRLRVKDERALSNATKSAMQFARRLGGYVAAVQYDSAREGTASLRLRIPITRVQNAVVRLSALGTIVGQGFRVEDLQRTVDRQRERLLRLKARVARLQEQLRNRLLPPETRLRLQQQLAETRQAVTRLQRATSQTVRRGRLAKVSLSLTTQQAAVAPSRPGRIERALDDAASVLAKEVAWTLYVLIVALPFLVTFALGLFGLRVSRRRAEQRLLAAS